MVYVVRANSHWFKFNDKQKAEEHYDYIINNLNGKYKNMDRVYLAQYEKGKAPKILKICKIPLQQEEEQGYGK